MPARTKEAGTATYIGLFNFTAQGIGNIKEGPARLDAAREQLGAMGITIKDMYLTFGRYDMVITIDAPDDATVGKAVLATGMQGNVSTETLRAFSEDEYRDIVGSLP